VVTAPVKLPVANLLILVGSVRPGGLTGVAAALVVTVACTTKVTVLRPAG
jgi:hypothetical protein